MIRLVIAEDMEILRDSLAGALDAQPDMEVVATTPDANEAVILCVKHHPNIALLDICMANGSSGIDATKKIKEKCPNIKIVVFTGMPDLSFVSDAKEAGADSFVYKNLGTKELTAIIRSTLNGYNTFPEKRETPKLANEDLSEREIQILRMTCEGKTRSEIAQTLGFSESTIKTYIREILSKTGYSSIARLAIYAISNGFITPKN